MYDPAVVAALLRIKDEISAEPVASGRRPSPSPKQSPTRARR